MFVNVRKSSARGLGGRVLGHGTQSLFLPIMENKVISLNYTTTEPNTPYIYTSIIRVPQ